MLRKNDKAFLQGPFAQVLIKGNQVEGFRRLFRPYERCGKLQRIRGPEGVGGKKPLGTPPDKL